MSVIVTGAAGFVGARVVERCNRQGLPVISVDALEYFEGHPEFRAEHRGLDFGTIIPRDELFDWLAREKPRVDAVIHMGACTDTTEMDREFLRKVNLEYSQKLWKWCAENQVPLIYASSAATYGEGEWGYDDDESQLARLKPLNPYGDSKQLFDLWALDQERQGVKPPRWAGFKFFNVYGFGERHKKAMASVVLHGFDQIRASGKVRLFKSHREGIADGHQKRDFIYVEDVVDVLFFAVESGLKRGIFNLGTGKARTFLDLVNATFAALAREPKVEFFDTPVHLRDKYQYFTEAKMDRLRAAGYLKPFTPIEEGVRRYVARLSKSSFT